MKNKMPSLSFKMCIQWNLIFIFYMDCLRLCRADLYFPQCIRKYSVVCLWWVIFITYSRPFRGLSDVDVGIP